MADENSQSLDVLGVKPVGEAIKITVEKSLDGAGAFLGKICLPVAEEVGLFLKDRVHIWRSYNVVNALKKAEKKYKKIHGDDKKEIHPKMLSSIIENVSWADSEEIQDMWAGLLASSCTDDGKDDSNLIFINLLSQLTNSQVKILNFACENSKKTVSEGGWIGCFEKLYINIDQLFKISQIEDLHRLDRELDYLRDYGLLTLGSGFEPNTTTARLQPSPLALHLYVRCQGSMDDAVKYFHKEITELQEKLIKETGYKKKK